MISGKNRTIDVAKGIGMLFVVFSHIVLSEPSLTIIYSFHMPLFFFLSGMVFNAEKYSSLKYLYKRKLQTMICPYVLFCLFGVLIKLVNYLISHEGTAILDFVKNAVFSIVWAPHSHKYFNSFNTPMWFVPCLLLVETLYFLLYKRLGKKKCLFYTSVLLITVFGWITEADIIPFDFSVLPWNFSSACFSLGFFAIGNVSTELFYSPTFKKQMQRKGTLKLIAICILLFAALVPVALLNGKVSIGSRVLHNGLLFYVTGLLGSCGVLALASVLKRSAFLTFYGRNSFAVMGSHILIYWILLSAITVAQRFGFPEKFPLFRIILFLLTVVLTVPFIILYNKITEKIRHARNPAKEPIA